MTPGFHWFVAWRYLMARPRRLSVSILAVALSLFSLAATAWALGHFLLEPARTHRFFIEPAPTAFLFWRTAIQCLLAGVAVGVFLWRRRAGVEPRMRPYLLGAAIAIAAIAAGATLWRDGTIPLPAPAQTDLYLTAVCAAAIGWLALVLLVIRYYFTFFTTVSIAGVGVGTMALVIVLSVMSGFEADLRQKILGSNAHIQITKEEGELTEYRALMLKVKTIRGVVAATPYATSEVVIAANSNYATVIIKGIDPTSVGKVTELEKDLKDPESLGRLFPLPVEDKVAPRPGGKTGTTPSAPSGETDGTDAGPATDPAPDDFGGGGDQPPDQPIDFSGDGEAAAAAAPSETPPDLGADDEPVIDFSGGETAKPAVAVRDDVIGAPPPAEVVDRAPDDFVSASGRPIDFTTSGVSTPRPRRDDHGLDDFDVDPFVRGAAPPPPVSARVAGLSGVLVGNELVNQIHLYPGQEVRMVSPLSDPSNPGGVPVPYTRNYRVAGSFYTGMYEYDLKFVYVELGSLQDFLDLGDQVNGIEIRVEDPDNPDAVVAAIQRALGPGYRVQDWKELNRNLFSALKLEKIAMFLVLAIIILVASFSIVGNLIMVVVEKAKEIALLKTLGAPDSGVTQIFVTQGFFIGAVGTLFGVFHGLLACELGKNFGLPLNPDVYYIDRLPIHEDTSSIVAVVIAGLLISVVATLYPAFVAARMRPVEGLRHQ